jgi:glycyl-tRNA synthetase
MTWCDADENVGSYFHCTAVRSYLEGLSVDDAKALEAKVKADGSAEVETSNGKFTVTTTHVQFDIKKETKTIQNYVPNVIEPSFGIDRIFTAVLEHSYYARPQDPEEKEKVVRGVLGLPANIAPYKTIILPLDQRVSAHEKYQAIEAEMRKGLSYHGLNYKVDDSGATVGKRYARNDELGVPLAVTVDFDSIGVGSTAGSGLDGTVTLRERDSLTQVTVITCIQGTHVSKFG